MGNFSHDCFFTDDDLILHRDDIKEVSVDVTSVTITIANSDDEDKKEIDYDIDPSSDSDGFMELINDADYL